MRARLRQDTLLRSDPREEAPLRSELFSADQMEQHGKSLAASHKLTPGRAPDPLLTRLAQNERILVNTGHLLTAAVKGKHRITLAGEWLLDNFYLIEDQIRTARRHLPKGYSRELPLLAQGVSAGLPRVYDLALETIAHGDGRVDLESLSRFVKAYQTVSILKLGELWAIPIMLRLALIENLRRVATLIAAGRIDRDLAESWADQMTTIAEQDPKSLILVIADMARSNPPMSTPFVSELVRRLQGHGPALALPLTWIEQRLSESNLTIEQLVQLGGQHQAADQVSISNSIGSLRLLSVIDWREFVEAMSVVDQTLREDPAHAYQAMNFATRDRYRHVVERVAKHSPRSEADVARTAIDLARAEATTSATRTANDTRTAHVGFYLIGKGLTRLERAVAMRQPFTQRLRKIGERFPLSWYIGGIALITLSVTGLLVAKLYADDAADWLLITVAVLVLLSTSQAAIAMINWLATRLTTPHALPRMDFSHGIPAESRALAVVPTMLTSIQGVENLVDDLEVRFLANRGSNLYFGLLTDLRDAREEHLPEDQPLLELAHERISELNEKYRGENPGAFFLFHRPRRWNPQEGLWMGYERKRGKLAELNGLLRGNAKDRFARVVGDMKLLATVKYVITLDTDTQLPRDAARELVGAMAHPLNRPRYHPAKRRIDEGYAILQPRVEATLPSINRSRYARLWSSEAGIDPYTRVVSDVYHDLFGEGSFIGKGIYDVDAFEQALSGCFPENRILSHDLLEGCYARSGLLSDVQLYEDFPARYHADVSRRHRWIRGDWQLARWITSSVPGFEPRRLVKNSLSALSRWKLFDNLRRSLVPTALSLLFVASWTMLPSAWFWTTMALGILLFPPLMESVLDLCNKPRNLSVKLHIVAVGHATMRRFSQALFTLACLPYEAYFSLDAIARTAIRLLFTHRRLLEWNPSSETERNGRNDLAAAFRSMWSASTLAAVVALYLVINQPATLAIAAPILFLWLISPVIAWWISRPLTDRPLRLNAGQTLFLHQLSRRTWAFFDTFVGPQDHWLPPDNFQEHPNPVVAHRTSPTNIGLGLLANLSAYDFGYICAGQFIERTANTFDTMASLERHRGHFYNWYDTLSLRPLHPTYVSSVDSGNLAGHLLTLRPGLLALPDHKILHARWLEGLQDTLSILVSETDGTAPITLAHLRKQIESTRAHRPATLTAARLFIENLATSAVQVIGNLQTGAAQEWAQALLRQCQAILDDVTMLAPWLALPAAPDGLNDFSFDSEIPSLRELAGFEFEWLPRIDIRLTADVTPEQRAWLQQFQRSVVQASARAQERMTRIERLAVRSDEFARAEYDFLYDEMRHLLAIGFNVDEHRRDASYYDLLASEARLCTFVAIAEGKLPQESWFALGRQLTATGGAPVLLSWSGSMFEYLMPLLVMPTYENTLLDRTVKAAVERQIEYGKQRGVPWGISESGYNTTDVHLNYQYRAFGVPGLGLKRGLAEDLVIAPYASVLALMVAPEAACVNLQRLSAEGFAGKFGFYEAIDYTVARLPPGQSRAVVQSFMAHHQGMSLLSLAYVLLERPMQKRFEANPAFQATLLLLQERIPKATPVHTQTSELAELQSAAGVAEMPVRIFSDPNTPLPEVQLLSNGRYHVMATNAGGGYSRWKDIAVTRWREDSTRDAWGTFCYLRDVASGSFWSTAHQPTLQQPKSYEAILSEGRMEYRRRDVTADGNGDFDTHTEIVVSPEDDIELRRLRIINRGRVRREIEVTSYAEVVLASSASDAAHPAFSNLFVQTEIIDARQAIICTRRPRSQTDPVPWMFHLMTVHDAEATAISYETDRMRFIGHGHGVADPRALRETAVLSGSHGSVLDPIVAIRYRIMLEPQQSVAIDMVFGMGETRESILAMIEKYHDRRLADRVFDLAWTHNQVILSQLNASKTDAQLYGRMANSIIYANSSLRAGAAILIKNRRGQSGLWGYAISGDLPIVLLQIKEPANIELVRQLVRAHAYWRLKGLAVDLVIWNEDHAGYRQLLQEQILGLIAAGIEANIVDRPGGIFVRPGDQISSEDRILLQSVARIIVTDSRGTLAEQIKRRVPLETRVPRFKATRSSQSVPAPAAPIAPRGDLILHNGLGGFTSDGHEYVITTTHEQTTPAPWCNVLANPQFGSVISESGLGYTWSENAHEFRLTPWHNDPVSDAGGEAFYIRDEERGHYWSPTPLPSRGAPPYVTRHGFGYSVFEHTERGIRSELWVYVAVDAAVKFAVLKIHNESSRPRWLSITGYVEWVLGDLRPKSAMHVITEIDPASGALLARNPYNQEFTDRVAFFDVDETVRTYSGDRTEFLGRNGTLKHPAAMTRSQLSGKVGAALDPCGALQVNVELAAGQQREIKFMLGVGQNFDDACQLIKRFRGAAAARGALEKVWHYWNRTLGAVQVETPDPSLNVLTNGWLLYQTLACRLWARSGFYQSGGAFGFRDQLQDTMALVHAEPRRLREQLLLCASRQFLEGDVQHWWHPPTGRGVRTQCSDDYLWLPLAACRYVSSTGDTGVLEESVAFLEGRPVNHEEDSYYDLPGRSKVTADLYEHCVRAIVRGLRFGAHGLPLIGSGDWNDGMNRVGIEGKGESIWLGFFLYDVLLRFSDVARLRGDHAFVERCRSEAAQLRQNIELHGWDGAWYRRAYFDDGTPLGSAANLECQIDAIAQSWSVLSNAGDAQRARTAMESVDRRLVRREHALIQLLDPPFDKSPLDPGYIKGYVPGVRENGGQYTHAAIWTAMAFAALGDGRRAWELLDMINPINHGLTAEQVATYKVEPYVVAADVYGVAPHTGRGGWTWYTGSAGWLYRLIVESLLGLRLEVDKLSFAPCLSAAWDTYKVHYRYRDTVYHIVVRRAVGEQDAPRMTVDGAVQQEPVLRLVDDRKEHHVEATVRIDQPI
ncbi:MAG: glucoamylase family protein [Pseudomonadota bacterium]